MRRTRKRRSGPAGALAIASMLLLTACSSGPSTETPTATQSTESVPEEAGEDTEAIEGSEETEGEFAEGHGHDYENETVEDLIGHIDHVDFDQLSPELRRDLEAELAKRDNSRELLWTTYGYHLSEEMPAEWESLDFAEYSYLLLSIRALHLAQAVEHYGSLEKAHLESRVGSESVLVKTDVTETGSGTCVSLTSVVDPFGRTYNGFSAAAPESLVRGLEEQVVIGVTPGEKCEGEPPSFSPAALEALESVNLDLSYP